MQAVIYEKPGDLHVAAAPDPTPNAGEVVIKVGAVGICGSDLNIAAGLFPPTPFPIIPGHEFAGEVVAVAPGIDFIHEVTGSRSTHRCSAAIARGAASDAGTSATTGAPSVTP